METLEIYIGMLITFRAYSEPIHWLTIYKPFWLPKKLL